MVPLHVLSTNVTSDLICGTLDLVVVSNMNMLRVWDGGMYNPEEYYDYAEGEFCKKEIAPMSSIPTSTYHWCKLAPAWAEERKAVPLLINQTEHHKHSH